jgi:hypothetical protein
MEKGKKIKLLKRIKELSSTVLEPKKDNEYNLGVVTPVQVMWIEKLINEQGDLDDVQGSYPDATQDEIATIVYEGVKSKRINGETANQFLGETVFDIPAVRVPVPKGDAGLEVPQPGTTTTTPHATPQGGTMIQVPEASHDLAVITPTQITWIENLINADGHFEDVVEAYPSMDLQDIYHVVHDAVKYHKISPERGNDFLGETFFKVPAGSVAVPQATHDLPQPHHNPNIPINPDYSQESSWVEWIIPLALTGLVIVAIGGIVYYIWKKRKKTPPTDSNGASAKVSSTSSPNKVSKVSSSSSKFSIDIFLKMVPILFLSVYVLQLFILLTT